MRHRLQQKMNQKQRYIKTLAGLQIELGILVSAVVSAYGYAWMSHMKINDTFIVVMLRSFIVFADLGMFLAIGYLVDFKRGVVIGYVYKVLAFLQIKQLSTASEWDFVIATVGKAFGLVLYYKLTLFLIIFTASYIVQIDHQETLMKKQEEEEEQKKLIKQKISEEKENVFSQRQKEELYSQEKIERARRQQKTSTQKTMNRIKLSLRYHKQQEFYKKLQIFFFVFYNSVCVLTLFPLQEHVLDFSKALGLAQSMEFFKHSQNLERVNQEVIWYMNMQTVWNVVMFWLVILVGEFGVKTRYPAMVKQYLLGVPGKFLLIQGVSLGMLIIALATKSVSSQQQLSSPQQQHTLSSTPLINLIHYQIFGVALMIHTLLPLFISFLLLRLYLGQTFHLNHLVSRKFSFHQNSDDGNSNLDGILYQCVIQDDINRVRHFIISPEELISRHKLKRYTDQEKLKHYVDEQTIVEVQSLFEDHLVLDLYNKLSRYIVMWMFYITLGVFMVSLNVNDTYFVMEDQFFVNVPAVMLWVGMFFVFKYQSTLNVFYPHVVSWGVKVLGEWLADRKAYNFIRLIHFYAIIFLIWLYRIYSEIFLPTHSSLQQRIKLTLYDYYSSPSHPPTGLMPQLLKGWAQYFTTHSSSCDYDLTELVVDSLMMGLVVGQVVVGHKYSQTAKSTWADVVLLVLKLVTPFYALFVFVVNMECMEWGRVTFCCCLCVGVMFMHVNQQDIKRGIVGSDESGMKESSSMY